MRGVKVSLDVIQNKRVNKQPNVQVVREELKLIWYINNRKIGNRYCRHHYFSHVFGTQRTARFHRVWSPLVNKLIARAPRPMIHWFAERLIVFGWNCEGEKLYYPRSPTLPLKHICLTGINTMQSTAIQGGTWIVLQQAYLIWYFNGAFYEYIMVATYTLGPIHYEDTVLLV